MREVRGGQEPTRISIPLVISIYLCAIPLGLHMWWLCCTDRSCYLWAYTSTITTADTGVYSSTDIVFDAIASTSSNAGSDWTPQFCSYYTSYRCTDVSTSVKTNNSTYAGTNCLALRNKTANCTAYFNFSPYASAFAIAHDRRHVYNDCNNQHAN